jgi:hypothetical protein
MKLPEVIACLRKHGVDASDLQTHSIRKTGATFGAASEFVSLMTICLRAAWAITAVMQKYIFREKGGDQQLGRVMAMMDPKTAEYNAHPPHFPPSEVERADNLVAQCFPSVENAQRLVFLRSMIASVIHHKEWLEENLATDHPLFDSFLFRDGIDLEYYSATCDEGEAPRLLFGLMDSPLQSTGTTLGSTILRELREAKEERAEAEKWRAQAESKIQQWIGDAVEASAVSSGQLTVDSARLVHSLHSLSLSPFLSYF